MACHQKKVCTTFPHFFVTGMIPTLIKCLCNNKNSFNRLKLIFPIDLCVSVQPYEMRHDGIGNNPSLAVVFAHMKNRRCLCQKQQQQPCKQKSTIPPQLKLKGGNFNTQIGFLESCGHCEIDRVVGKYAITYKNTHTHRHSSQTKNK